MTLKHKIRKLTVCFLIFLSVNPQNMDSVKIHRMIKKNVANIDSAKYYSIEMQKILKELKKKHELSRSH